MRTLCDEWRALWRSRQLMWVLTRREVAARYQGTAMGVVWLYLQPLCTVAAYYLVFDVVFRMRLGDGAPTRAVGAFLVVGALPWMAMCDAISRGMNSLIDAGGLLQKNALPTVLFPVRAVLASQIIFAPLLLLVALAYAPLHGFQWPVASVLGLLLAQLCLSLLLGYALAILAAALRDTVQLVGFLLSVGIYLSPILFPLTLFPEQWRWLLWLNPVTALVLGYQSALLQGMWPQWQVWVALLAWMLLLAVVLSILVKRSRDELVDWL
ncbi:MAG TPA: ABC transporter [Delftia acidovorans]|uniref:Transport permease protein n=1 Tax=Chryseobacterium sp. B5 TaxID=2050562 RepID=A0A2G7TBR4_9FLAO|nr:ABC transporter [Delftia acidovorans]HBJ99896.1 ABC transporter [Delftia acidovorans]